jgi:hypothetical protein
MVIQARSPKQPKFCLEPSAAHEGQALRPGFVGRPDFG